MLFLTSSTIAINTMLMQHQHFINKQNNRSLLEIDINTFSEVFRFISFHPFEQFPIHHHERIEINHVKKGNCTINIDQQEILFREGELMVISSNIPHSFQAGSKGCTLMQLEFHPGIFSHLGHDFISIADCFTQKNRNNPIIHIINDIRTISTVRRIIEELQTKDPQFEYIVQMGYIELLILISRHINKQPILDLTPSPLKIAIDYIHTNYSSPISIREVAVVAKISERYLRQLFSKHINTSPIDYLNSIRINKAIELLQFSELLNKEVCFLCGFTSPQYFSRVFTRQVGMTPKLYRKTSLLANSDVNS